MKSWTNLSLPLFRVVSEKLNPSLFGHSWRRSILFFLTAAAILTSASITGAFAQEKKMKEHTASVSGRVTIDDKPAAGVLVTLRKAYSYSSDDPVPSATTDLDGKFTIADVHGGDYAVIPAAPALVLTDGFGVENGYVVIHLGDGEEKEGIRLKLARGGVIAGKVTTAEGWPLIGLRIEVWRVDGDHPTAVSLGDHPDLFKTDDRGVYRVYGLRPGRYLIRARGEEIGGLTATFHPAAIEASQATPVHVALGDEVTNVNVVMGKPAPSYSASGRVIDEQTRRPLRGGRLTLEGESNRRWAVEIDQEGQFRINTLPAGKYLLVIGLGDNAEYYSDPLPFQISEADVAGLEIVARRGTRVGGQLVFEDGLHGELFQRPNALWLSLMTRPDKPNQVSSGLVARIESDGRFSFSG